MFSLYSTNTDARDAITRNINNITRQLNRQLEVRRFMTEHTGEVEPLINLCKQVTALDLMLGEHLPSTTIGNAYETLRHSAAQIIDSSDQLDEDILKSQRQLRHLKEELSELEASQQEGVTTEQVEAMLYQLDFVVPGSVEVLRERIMWVNKPVEAQVLGTQYRIRIPETHVTITKYNSVSIVEAVAEDGEAVDNNYHHIYRYDITHAFSVHPHVIEITPCFGDFSSAIFESIANYDIGTAAILIHEFLKKVDPNDVAGQRWTNYILSYYPDFDRRDYDSYLVRLDHDGVADIYDRFYDEDEDDYRSEFVASLVTEDGLHWAVTEGSEDAA